MAPHTIAGSHPRRDVSPRRDRPRPTWRSIPGRPRLRAPSGRGMPGTAPQDTTPVAARLATCRETTFGPALAAEKSVPCTRHAALHLCLGARFVNPWHVQGLNPPLVRDVQSTAALLQGASANTARPAAHGFVESVRAYRRGRPLDASAERTVAAVLTGRKSWSWGPKVTSRSTTRTCARSPRRP